MGRVTTQPRGDDDFYSIFDHYSKVDTSNLQHLSIVIGY